jgi:stress-induced-phosphoprotein 1
LCEKAVEIGREHHTDYKVIAKAFARIANAYLKQDRLKEALHYFDKSVSEFRDPQVVRTRQELEKKVKEGERLAYINPEKALEEKNKGNEAYQKGDFPTALKHYTEAIKRNPEDAKLYSNRAACYAKLMEFRYALEDCDKCIKLEPTFIKGYIRKGMALMALHDPSRAMRAYEEALRLDPNSAEAADGVRAAAAALEKDPNKVKDRVTNDPEIQAILADPAMRMILEQMTQDPKAVREHLKNPDIAEKITKLLDAGVIGMR